MHNLVSRNELSNWKWEERETMDQKYDQVTDYFQCISECGITDNGAKRSVSYTHLTLPTKRIV